jgi:hypothetical protein
MLGWEASGRDRGQQLNVTGRLGRAAEAMLTSWQAQQDEIILTLAGVRAALHGVRVEIQRTAAQHEQLADWYVKQGDEAAAWVERRAAAVQRQRLADLNAAFQALEEAVSAAIDLDP